jgi:uncharacterized protein YkwD
MRVSSRFFNVGVSVLLAVSLSLPIGGGTPEQVMQPEHTVQPEQATLLEPAEQFDEFTLSAAEPLVQPQVQSQPLVQSQGVAALADDLGESIYGSIEMYDLARSSWDYQNGRLAEMSYPQVDWSDALYYACLVRAEEISRSDSFSHTRPNGSSFDTAVTELGLPSSWMGENIYSSIGYGNSVEDNIEAFIDSPGHFATMTGGYQFGACAIYLNAEGKVFWVQIYWGQTSSPGSLPEPDVKPGGGGSVAASSKNITLFSLVGTAGSISTNTITVLLPFGTSLTSLNPLIIHNGVSIEPVGRQNFTSPVTYTVTAEDDSTKSYMVDIKFIPSPHKNITSFMLAGVMATITDTTITATLPYGTNTSLLTPTITHTGASITPASGSPQNFSSPVTYTVRAYDGSTKSYTVTITVDSAPPTSSPPDGLYTISPKCAPGLVIDIAGGSADTGANVQIWVDNNSPAQTFRLRNLGGGLFTLTNIGSGKLLDVEGAGQQSGTKVHQWDSNNTDAQKWQLVLTGDSDGSYYLKSACNALYLDISAASSSNGARVQVYTGNATSAQKFYFNGIMPVLAAGNYTIVSALSSSSRTVVVDISGGSMASTANVQLWESNNTGAQKFRFAYDAQTGYYTISNLQSGLPLDVAGASPASGTNVWQYSANGSRAQWWRIVVNADGTYSIVSATGNGCCLDAAGAGTANGTNIWIYTPNNTNAQKWRLTLLP